jgi:AraC family transcriptional regulator of adaptative response / DNA-3-methyladenine glycosylase II
VTESRLAYSARVTLDPDVCYRALATRDARFDGRFFTCVRTTGVYCRPVCPARTPRRENVTFAPHAAAAESAGFRPCRRCRPDAAPWTPAWTGTGATVSRGLRLIDDGVLDDDGLAALAARLGVGPRHLARLFLRHVGATPARIARTRRVHFARELVERSSLPLTRVAFEAGFASVRRFNEAFLESFGRSPSALRRGGARGRDRTTAHGLALRLAFRPPYDWTSLARFLAARALPGVESVTDEEYVRAFVEDGRAGAIRVAPVPGAHALEVRLTGARPPRLADVARRVRRMFDLDADPMAIAERFRASELLRPLVAARPGLRIPGAWDVYETAVRAVLGQQVTVAAGRKLCARLVDEFGAAIDPPGPGLARLFPAPDVLAEADVAHLGLPRERAATVRAVAAAFASGVVPRDGTDADEVVARLSSIRGVGPWTAQYVALRGCGAPDAFPSGDLVLRTSAGVGAPVSERELTALAESWRPWRGYAAIHLWTAAAVRKEAMCATT